MIQKEYISKNHSKFLIKYHVIFVCKYRKKLLVGAVEYDMKQIMHNIADMSDFYIEVMETDKDHLKHTFYKENTFWTDGYFVSSIGNVSQETITKYIEKQG